MTAPAEKLATAVDDLRRRVNAMEKTGQLSRSTVQIDDEDLAVPDVLAEGLSASRAIPGLDARLTDAAAAVEAASKLAEEAKAAADAAGTGEAAEEAKKAADAALAKAKEAVDAADAASGLAQTAQSTADGKSAVRHSSVAPPSDASGTTKGDLWFVIPDESTGVVTGQWRSDGTTWSEQTLDSAVIAALDAGKITSGYVSADRLKADSIAGEKIVAGSLSARELAADSVTAAKLAVDAVLARNIKAGTITSEEIAGSTITGANIKAGSIAAGQLAAGAVTADKIAAGAITAENLAADAIDGKTIRGVTITGATLQATGSTSDQAVVNIDNMGIALGAPQGGKTLGRLGALSTGPGQEIFSLDGPDGNSSLYFYGTSWAVGARFWGNRPVYFNPPIVAAKGIEFGDDSVQKGAALETTDTDTGWVRIRLNSGFDTTVDRPAEYRKIGNRVYFRGQVSRSSGNFSSGDGDMFTMPPNLRPPQHWYSPTPNASNSGAVVRWRFLSTGPAGVSAVTGSTSYIMLDSMFYFLD